MIIGLTGTIASGKSTVAEILKKKGFEHFTYSDILRIEAKKRGIEQMRENLQKLGTEIKQQKGNGILSKLILENAKSKNVIADGIRTVDEIIELKKAKNSIVIGIDAPQKMRFERLMSRARSGDPMTFEKFVEIDNNENLGVRKGQEINNCLNHVDYLIINDSSVEELGNKLDKIIRKK